MITQNIKLSNITVFQVLLVMILILHDPTNEIHRAKL